MSLLSICEVPAPAKLNLFLHVVGRRDDGYHLLQSVFLLIDWCDTLHFERRQDGRLQRHDLGPALPADDLSLRAARALQQASGCTWGVDLSVDKQVPWGAGLGGGSSDAASTLLALNRLWGLHWPRQRLVQLGLALGADVPFFVGGDNAFVQGVGERLTALDLPPAHYAVVKPPTSIATRDIFEHPALKRDSKPLDQAATLLGSLKSDEYFGCNDLQGAAEDRCEDVKTAARWLKERFGNSRMTGSGSAVFSWIASHTGKGAPPALLPTAELPPGWTGRICLGLQQHPLRGWAD